MSFVFHFFILLYTMVYFLMDGGKLLNKIQYYLPLDDDHVCPLAAIVKLFEGSWITGEVQRPLEPGRRRASKSLARLRPVFLYASGTLGA